MTSHLFCAIHGAEYGFGFGGVQVLDLANDSESATTTPASERGIRTLSEHPPAGRVAASHAQSWLLRYTLLE